jgi:hypothetical protein
MVYLTNVIQEGSTYLLGSLKSAEESYKTFQNCSNDTILVVRKT